MAAPPLECSYRLTRADWMRYFVCHFFFDRWSPWIVTALGGAVYGWFQREGGMAWAILHGAGMMVGTLVLGFLGSCLIYWLNLRKMKDDGIALEEKHLVVDADALVVRGAASEGRYLWQQFSWTKLRKHFQFLKLEGAEIVILLPRRDVPSDITTAIARHVARPEA